MTCLDLSCNNIVPAAAAPLAVALRANTTLITLDLSANGMADAGVVAVAQALAANKSTALQLLDLRANLVDDAGASAVAEMLKTNTSLRALSLKVL